MNTSPKTFEDWKAACVAASEKLGLEVGDMWEEFDPYDLFDTAEDAFKNKISPEVFIEEAFEEDLARRAGDDLEFEESLREEEAQDGFDEDPGFDEGSSDE